MKRKNKCSTAYCRNVSAHGKNYCHKCRGRRYKKNNPLHYCFNVLKQNAKRRGKIFSLSFFDFINFCNETDYMNKKGNSALSFSIDRIDNNRGYTLENIQCITKKDNSIKYTKTPF